MPATNRQSGSALILVLWIIGMLSLVVVSFAFEAHLEGKVVSFARKSIRADALATSGLELAKSAIDRGGRVTGDETDEEKAKDPQYETANSLRLGKSVTLARKFRTRSGADAGSVRVDIEPEDSRRNINKLSEEDWEQIFEMVGVPEKVWPDLIDSYFDWIDADDTPRENGAETDDYYATLEKPRAAANAPFASVGELRLVKGFTEPVLTGGVFNPEDPPERQVVISNGVERLFTTYGEGKVNVNALRGDLGLAILRAFPGVDEIAANAILEERETGVGATGKEEAAFRDEADARQRLADYVEGTAFFDGIATKSTIYRITSVGQVGRVTKRVRAIVYADRGVWRILRWVEEPE